MAATLCVARSVKRNGCKGEWLIKDEDVKECGGIVFVKLSAQNSSLSTLLGNMGGYRCLSRSIGFRNLKQLRNQNLVPVLDVACTLFDDAPPKPSPSKVPRAVLKCPDSCLQVEVEVDGVATAVNLLLSSYRDDSLFIAFEEHTINAVLKYIIEKGFDAEPTCKSKHKRDGPLPTGIWRHVKGYTVNYTDSIGNKRQKFTKILDTALKIYAGEIDPDVKAAETEPDEGEGELHES